MVNSDIPPSLMVLYLMLMDFNLVDIVTCINKLIQKRIKGLKYCSECPNKKGKARPTLTFLLGILQSSTLRTFWAGAVKKHTLFDFFFIILWTFPPFAKVRVEPDGHLRGRICSDLDCFVGGDRPHVDLRRVQLLKGEQNLIMVVKGKNET